MPEAAIFQARIGNANVAIPGAAVTPLPLQVVTYSSPLITHVLGSSEIEFQADGIFVAYWATSINNTNANRSNSQTALFLDSGGGFFPIIGTTGYGYHRTTAQGRDTTVGFLRSQPVTRGDKIEVASQRIAGTGALQFIAASCYVLLGFLPVG